MGDKNSKTEKSSRWNTPRDPKLGEKFKNTQDSNGKKKR